MRSASVQACRAAMVGGALVAALGAAVSFAGVRGPQRPGNSSRHRRPGLGRSPRGVQAVRADPLLTRLAVVQVLASLSAGATSGLLVVLAERWLDVGPSGFGFLLASIGAGAATGPLLLRRFVRAGNKR